MEASRDACSSLDFREELPPIRNQGYVGWCYGFTAADLLSHRSGQNISPVELSLNYAHHENLNELIALGPEFTSQSPLGNMDATTLLPENLTGRLAETYQRPSDHSGGFVGDSILTSQTRGYCLENKNQSYDDILRDASAGIQQVDSLRSTYDIIKSAGYDDIICAEAQRLQETFFPSLDIDQIIQITSDPSHLDPFFDATRENCRENRVEIEASPGYEHLGL